MAAGTHGLVWRKIGVLRVKCMGTTLKDEGELHTQVLRWSLLKRLHLGSKQSCCLVIRMCFQGGRKGMLSPRPLSYQGTLSQKSERFPFTAHCSELSHMLVMRLITEENGIIMID